MTEAMEITVITKMMGALMITMKVMKTVGVVVMTITATTKTTTPMRMMMQRTKNRPPQRLLGSLALVPQQQAGYRSAHHHSGQLLESLGQHLV